MKTSEFIVSAASYYIGQLEKKANSGFVSEAFEKEMKAVGFYKGAPWCMFFVKLIWKKAYRKHETLSGVVNRMLNGSALMSYNNMKNNKSFELCDEPLPGSIVIWRYGNTDKGHAGIVIAKIDANTFKTIEGNTNQHGSREGEIVAEKLRTLIRPFKSDGLNLIGFINPIEL